MPYIFFEILRYIKYNRQPYAYWPIRYATFFSGSLKLLSKKSTIPNIEILNKDYANVLSSKKIFISSKNKFDKLILLFKGRKIL